jgi:hypothetical protein
MEPMQILHRKTSTARPNRDGKNIKTIFREIYVLRKGGGWLAQDRVQWRPLVSAVLNLRVLLLESVN